MRAWSVVARSASSSFIRTSEDPEPPVWYILEGIGTMTYVTRLAEQRRQLGDVGCYPPCVVAREQLRQRSPARVIREIDIGDRLAVPIPYNDAAVEFFDGPWRWKTVGHDASVPRRRAWRCVLRHTTSARRFRPAQSAGLSTIGGPLI